MTAHLVTVPPCATWGLAVHPLPGLGPIIQWIKAVLHFSINVIVQTNSMPKDLLLQTA